MANTYDAIVIGGGHNGLVAGAYLARSGARTVVLEARHKTGGAAATDAPWPEAPQFRVTTYSYVMSLMPNTIINDLGLKRHGYKVYPMGPYYQAWPDGTSIKLFADDAKANYESIGRISKKDAETLPKWDAWLHGIAEVLGPMLMAVPPRLGSKRPGDLLAALKTAWKMRGLDVRGVADVTRLFSMSVTDLLDDWFESKEIKAALAVNGIIGTWAGPDEPGTAYVMVHHSIGDVGDGHLGGWGFPEGGMGAVTDAIRRSAESFGCEIRTGAPVDKVIVKDGRACGVALKGGEELRAPGRRDDRAPQDRLPAAPGAQGPAAGFRHGHRALEEPQRRRQGQPRHRGAAELQGEPRQPAPGTSQRLGGALPLDQVLRGGVPGREGRARRAPALRRRGHPDLLGQDADASGDPHLLHVHAVGAPRVVARAPPGRARGLRGPYRRRLQRAGAELQELRSCTGR